MAPRQRCRPAGGVCTPGTSCFIRFTGVITNLATGTIRSPSERIIPYGCCADGTLENGGTLHNAGAIYTEGSLSNLGSLNNAPTGTIALQFWGYFDPFGRGSGVTDTTLVNSGSIDNAGTIGNRGGAVSNMGTIHNTGAFNNSVEFLTVRTTWEEPTIYSFGYVSNVTTVVNDGIITDCGNIWGGNAPQGNPVVHQNCSAYLPFVEHDSE